MSDPVTEYVESDGSGYTIRVDVLDPAEDPELEREGYRSETVLYAVLNDGQVYADHDRHALVRELPGSNGWLLDELAELGQAALDAESGA